ncbi:KAT8 regulatory NSL complex subunit 1-like protein isoform X11 [Mus musculus]|uniref:KAT8 regulatory NSL complex subunit 1-like protein isoform X11 n=1 Tax=Mus musculus TaxID=10090 RepID=UPI0007EC78CD|nr:KAT8 regulatory NSL complex subunit 1-like protein isoform X11 [Mus musculus]|eukprot:XP_017177805.1 PREDICTED: KAT8 regulatory NSL complex subunit 1-like protein isoform X9 [Mus musculus]
MTPALKEATTKGICFSSLPNTMESDKMLCMESPRTVDEKLKGGDTFSQMLGFPTPEPTLNTNFVNLKHFASPQASKHFQTVLLMSSNSTLNKYNENYNQKKVMESNCSKLKNVLCNGSSIQLSKICPSHSENEFIKKELSDTTSQCMKDIQIVLDSNLTKDANVDRLHLQNCKWYQKNALLDKFTDTKIKKGLLQCTQKKIGPSHSDVPTSSSAAEKEQEVNARLLHCVSKQKILLSQARRTQKHLQMLLAKHVVKHYGQQMKFSMKHQLPTMKIFHEPTTVLSNSLLEHTEIKPEVNILASENKFWDDTNNGFSQCTAAEIQRFALSATGLLSHVEEGLDSDATDSSSDDELDEYTIRKNVAVVFLCSGCPGTHYVDQAVLECRAISLPVSSECWDKSNSSTEWKWLVDRAQVGSRWTWLQAQISELEYKIQQLTDIHRQIRASKVPQRSEEPLPEHDFEMSPSSPTLLLRNIEKQSAQLTEIINSLIAPLNLSPTSSPLSSKSCSHKCLANGISRSASENLDELSSSSSWLLNQKHSKKRRKDRTRLKSPSLAIMSTAARTRPLQSFHKRKLYRLSPTFYWTPETLPSKEAFLSSTQTPYTGSPFSWDNWEQSSRSHLLREQVSKLDSSFHPVLSLPSEIPLHLHFETLFKKTDMKGELAENQFVGDCLISPPPAGERTRFEEFAFQRSEPGSHCNFTAVSNANVTSRTQNPSSQNTSRRRLRSESSYDIDNIVIPMSLVAPAKLEKLQYKEILTPRWRKVVLQPLDEHNLNKEEIEDLSDDVFSLRHRKYEEREQARWSLWEQSKWHRRNNRAYSKNVEGQDLVLKEHSSELGSAQQGTAESPFELPAESHSLCAQDSLSLNDGQEDKSLRWERRAFPLKDEDTAALLCQDERKDQTGGTSTAFHDEVFCSTTPESGHPPKMQLDGMEEYKSFGIGVTNVKRNR